MNEIIEGEKANGAKIDDYLMKFDSVYREGRKNLINSVVMEK